MPPSPGSTQRRSEVHTYPGRHCSLSLGAQMLQSRLRPHPKSHCHWQNERQDLRKYDALVSHVRDSRQWVEVVAWKLKEKMCLAGHGSATILLLTPADGRHRTRCARFVPCPLRWEDGKPRAGRCPAGHEESSGKQPIKRLPFGKVPWNIAESEWPETLEAAGRQLIDLRERARRARERL